MKTSKKKPARRILGFKEWLKVNAQKQDAVKDKGQKPTPNPKNR